MNKVAITFTPHRVGRLVITPKRVTLAQKTSDVIVSLNGKSIREVAGILGTYAEVDYEHQFGDLPASYLAPLNVELKLGFPTMVYADLPEVSENEVPEFIQIIDMDDPDFDPGMPMVDCLAYV